MKALGRWWCGTPRVAATARQVFMKELCPPEQRNKCAHTPRGEIHESASRAAHSGTLSPPGALEKGRSRLTIVQAASHGRQGPAAATCKAWSRSGAAMLELLFDRPPIELYSAHREYAGERRRSLQPAGVWAGVLAPPFERKG